MQRVCIQALMLAALVALSLAGCAAHRAIADRPVEGPVRLGETAAVDGPRVRPDRIIEDSRCPLDVQCIQAGRLIVQVTVFDGGGPRQMKLTMGVPVPVADGTLTLVGATPATLEGNASASAPRFTFQFQGGR